MTHLSRHYHFLIPSQDQEYGQTQNIYFEIGLTLPTIFFQTEDSVAELIVMQVKYCANQCKLINFDLCHIQQETPTVTSTSPTDWDSAVYGTKPYDFQ